MNTRTCVHTNVVRYANSKDVAAAQRTYEELLASDLEPNDITLSNMIVAHSWGDVKEMTR